MVTLRRVVVCESVRLGRRSALDVTLYFDGGQVTCKADIHAMKKISARELAGWLDEQLGPARVVVRQETRVDREFQCPEQWWRPGTVASIWRVPVSEVPRIAFQRSVPTYAYTPRAYAMHSPHKLATVYDPGRVYEVARELHAERSATSNA